MFFVHVTVLSFQAGLCFVEMVCAELSALILSFLSTEYLVECTTLALVPVSLLLKFYTKFLSGDKVS